MGDELWELATREDSSKFADEEQEVGPEVSHEEAPEAPRIVTSPIPLFGIPPKARAMSFGTFDDVSVGDLVNFVVLRQSAPPMQEAGKPMEGLFTGKADATTNGKFLDPMVGSPPPYMDFTAFVSGEDVSLVDKLANVATTSTGGYTPLTIASGQVKIKAPPRYSIIEVAKLFLNPWNLGIPWHSVRFFAIRFRAFSPWLLNRFPSSFSSSHDVLTY